MSNASGLPTAARKERIVFIDVLRAYAILMMLQGHFVDTLLAETYRTAESTLYYLWAFMRGMTAPIFFTVTGLVFVYLLLRDGRPLAENKRVKKGLRRGGFLVLVGYGLKICVPALLVGYISPWTWSIDVLHIIGIALIGLIGVCALREVVGGSLAFWMLAFGIGTFLMDPYFTENTWENTPRFLAHYFTRDFGSNFTIVPWLGFAFFGGTLGYVLSRRPKWAFTLWLPALLFAFGITLTKGSHQMLVNLYELTSWDYFPVLFNNNYLFWRLGHVLMVMALFMWAVPRIGAIPKLVTKIGGETLTIYGVHYVVLYGTTLGIGLSQLIGYRTLDPLTAIVGAAAFVFAHVMLIKNIEAVREWIYVRVPAYLRQQYRRLVVWYVRYRPIQQRAWAQRWADRLAEGPSFLLPLARVFARRVNK